MKNLIKVTLLCSALVSSIAFAGRPGFGPVPHPKASFDVSKDFCWKLTKGSSQNKDLEFCVTQEKGARREEIKGRPSITEYKTTHITLKDVNSKCKPARWEVTSNSKTPSDDNGYKVTLKVNKLLGGDGCSVDGIEKLNQVELSQGSGVINVSLKIGTGKKASEVSYVYEQKTTEQEVATCPSTEDTTWSCSANHSDDDNTVLIGNKYTSLAVCEHNSKSQGKTVYSFVTTNSEGEVSNFKASDESHTGGQTFKATTGKSRATVFTFSVSLGTIQARDRSHVGHLSEPGMTGVFGENGLTFKCQEL